MTEDTKLNKDISDMGMEFLSLNTNNLDKERRIIDLNKLLPLSKETKNFNGVYKI